MHCSNCGETLSETSNLCSGCGETVRTDALILELEKLESDQARIDRIGADLESGQNRYSELTAYELFELVGSPDIGSGISYGLPDFDAFDPETAMEESLPSDKELRGMSNADVNEWLFCIEDRYPWPDEYVYQFGDPENGEKEHTRRMVDSVEMKERLARASRANVDPDLLMKALLPCEEALKKMSNADVNEFVYFFLGQRDLTERTVRSEQWDVYHYGEPQGDAKEHRRRLAESFSMEIFIGNARDLYEYEHPNRMPDEVYLRVASPTVTTSEGEEIYFEAIVTDETILYSPYELKAGKGFDEDEANLVEMDWDLY